MRLFVGLDFPDSVKERLLALETGLPGIRWSKRDQLHLTLFFIGETEKNHAVQAALAGVEAAAFALSLGGVGRFPEKAKAPPRVLWAGVAHSEALHQLQGQVSSALVQAGFQAEARAFQPHIALARLKNGAAMRGAVQDYIAHHNDFEVAAVPVEGFVLFSSQLTPQGAIYTHEAVYPLRAQP